MKKFKLVILFFLTLTSNSLSAQNCADSLSFYYENKNADGLIKLSNSYLKSPLKCPIENKKLLINIFCYLGNHYMKKGNYFAANDSYLNALNLFKSESDFTEKKIVILIKLITINTELKTPEKNEIYYNSIIKFYKDRYGYKTKEVSFYLNNLATLLKSQKRYEEVEKYYLEALEISKNNFENNLQDYFNSLNGLAELYSIQKKYDKSEKLYYNELKYIDSNDKFQELRLDFLNGLSEIYLKQKKYGKAEILLNHIQESNIKIFGKNNIKNVLITGNLANLYSQKGDQFKAIESYLRAIELFEVNNFSPNIDYANLILRLSKVFKRTYNYSKYDYYLLKSLAMAKSSFDKKGVNYIRLNTEIATSNNSLLLEIVKDINENFELINEKLNNGLDYLSSNEILIFKDLLKKDLYFPLSFLHRYPNQYEKINIGCYENELLLKNLSLRNQQRITNSIQKSGDAPLKEKYKQFINNKRELNKWNELALNERPTNYEQLTAKTETLEKELIRQSSAFTEAKNSLSINWKQIQDKLQDNELAIDLVAFSYYNKKWTDSIVCSAFVVGKNFKAPKYIPLFEQKQLEFFIKRNSKDHDTIQATNLNKQYSYKAVSDLFLKPLANELKGIATIYLSPSGLGNQIDFSALPVSETQTLGEKYQVHILGSTAEIVNYKVAHLDPKTNLELVLYGNIDYDKSEATNKVTSDTLVTNNVEFTVLTTRSSAVKEYGYLAGSKVEVNKINALALKNNFSSTIIDDKKATEESIKLLDGRITPFVLHLATHGFFFPDPKQELPKEDLLSDSKSKIFKTADDPMMRSGLLFAGANTYWGKPTENIMTDDGILTASEISNLDLSACELVVMSACETGLGDVNGSEGVFGLQRAFKMAGVKNIIMSLWKVPDVQTAELFDVFYTECFAGKTIHEAFQTAQAKMKVKYSPYYWAGFVLLE
jgi:CHAT domain-containing protein